MLVWMCAKCKKPWFKKSEMHGDLPFKKGSVVSASKRRRGAPKIKQKGGNNMVSEEVVVKAVEALRGFSPEVLSEAFKEIPGIADRLKHNFNFNL